jgi:outer membrane protein assembly factor BamE (lipoprotein component of BamABCDE complex)
MNPSRTFASRIRPHILACCLGAGLPLLNGITNAETIAIPLGQQGKEWQVETPNTGMSKSQVEARFGQPLEHSGPVGTPPIYTWDYGQFTVYFEGDHVIHAVVKAPTKN